RLLFLVLVVACGPIVGEPLDVDLLGCAAGLLVDQPLAALVPPFPAVGVFVAEEAVPGSELLRLAEKGLIGRRRAGQRDQAEERECGVARAAVPHHSFAPSAPTFV